MQKIIRGLTVYKIGYGGIGIASLPDGKKVLIKGLLLDSEKAEYKPAITTLGVKETLEELKKVNTDFEAQLSQRAEAEIAANPLPAKELRAELDEFYDTATRRVDAFNLLTPTAESWSFVTSLNKLIKDTNSIRKLHKTQLGMWTEEGGREDEEESQTSPSEKQEWANNKHSLLEGECFLLSSCKNNQNNYSQSWRELFILLIKIRAWNSMEKVSRLRWCSS